MKKLFTIDDFMVAFISSLGFGYGTAIGKLLGWPEAACMAASFALGTALSTIINKIAFSKEVQKNQRSRVIVYSAFLLIFLAAHYFSVKWMGVSMLDYLGEEIINVVGLPSLGFVFNLLLRAWQTKKIRKLYGDGSDGYVFDVKQKAVDEINQQNQAVTGKYDADCAVKTKNGIYVGGKYKGTISFLGIPYAKPPVDELRWKAPQPLPASDAVFEAKNFGASAIQVELKGAILKNHRQSEDCLTLNIAVGAKKKDEKKPVLVLFHNGDFTCGGSADPLLYGADFVNDHQDVVFVSFNYRLGIFGFIDFSDVPGGEAFPDAMNLGLLDQAAALKWIKENIAAFGGDPDRITVLGFDAGASSILMLAATGQAKALFGKAFVFNGSPTSAYDTPAAARALAKSLLKETHTSTMDELMHLNTETLKDAAQKLWQNMCAPTCDGKWIPLDMYQAFRDGAAADIEFIIGIPHNYTKTYRSLVGGQNYEEILSMSMTALQNAADDSVANAVQSYLEKQTASSTELEAKSKLIEQILALYVYRSAVKLAEGGNKVHLMYWNEKPLIENLGSGTTDAAAALLGNAEALQMYGSVLNTDVSEALQCLLQKFIKGEDLQLYQNEIKGIDAFDWKAFPQALIVSDGKLLCDTLEKRITEIKGLLELMTDK